uniref:AP180 N-terminal homology (ANTH) domain-containing protein n=1 Tax=Medicago truncatula TaxID=3880 RepID=I3SWX7_MEDTR|nr:unknown [Medicago truncatula]
MHEIFFMYQTQKGQSLFCRKDFAPLCKTKDNLVSLKTLVLIHRLLRGGNRTFEQELCKAHVSGPFTKSA